MEWTERHHHILMNTTGTPTDFPQMANLCPTIPDLTVTRGHAFTISQSWSADSEGGGNSDYALITTLLSICPPEFLPKMQHQGTDWENFRATMNQIPPSTILPPKAPWRRLL